MAATVTLWVTLRAVKYCRTKCAAQHTNLTFPSLRIQKFKSDLHVSCPPPTKDQTRPLTFLGCSMQISFPFVILGRAGAQPFIPWVRVVPGGLNDPLFLDIPKIVSR